MHSRMILGGALIRQARFFALRLKAKGMAQMEVHFTLEIEKKLNELAMQSGRPAAELVQDAVAGMFDELAETREMLDRRYDDIKSGRVELTPGEKAFARLHERIEARRNGTA